MANASVLREACWVGKLFRVLGKRCKCFVILSNVIVFVMSVERDGNGNPLNEARCEACNATEPAFSAPDATGKR